MPVMHFNVYVGKKRQRIKRIKTIICFALFDGVIMDGHPIFEWEKLWSEPMKFLFDELNHAH